MIKNEGILFLLLSFMLVGCSHIVPLRHDMMIDKTLEQKIDQRVLLVISAEQAKLVTRYKINPLSNSIIFEGGAAFKDMFTDTLNQIYREVKFANTLAGSQNYDIAVEVDFKNAYFKVSPTIKSVQLKIDYTIFDRQGKKTGFVQTNVLSENKVSKGTAAKRILIPLSYGNLVGDLGEAWDKASEESIGLVIDKLLLNQ